MLLALAGTIGAAGTASADGAARHCVAGVTEATAAADSVVGPSRCFTTEGAAVEFATGGRVSAGAADAAIRESRLPRLLAESGSVSTATTAVAQPVIGRLFDSTQYDGGSQYYYAATGDGCFSPGSAYQVSYVGSYWNDDFSSGWGVSGCLVTVYQHANFLTPSFGEFYNAPTFYALNEEVSSLKFRH